MQKEKEQEQEQEQEYVIVSGNVSHGFVLHGPYPSLDSAIPNALEMNKSFLVLNPPHFQDWQLPSIAEELRLLTNHIKEVLSKHTNLNQQRVLNCLTIDLTAPKIEEYFHTLETMGDLPKKVLNI